MSEQKNNSQSLATQTSQSKSEAPPHPQVKTTYTTQQGNQSTEGALSVSHESTQEAVSLSNKKRARETAEDQNSDNKKQKHQHQRTAPENAVQEFQLDDNEAGTSWEIDKELDDMEKNRELSAARGEVKQGKEARQEKTVRKIREKHKSTHAKWGQNRQTGHKKHPRRRSSDQSGCGGPLK